MASIVDNAIWKIFYELKAYQIIPLERIELLSDGTIIYPELSGDRDYAFGSVRSGVLTWTHDLNQLANAVFEIRELLGFAHEDPNISGLTRRIRESEVLKLARGKFSTLQTYLKELKREDQDWERNPFVTDASSLILLLLKKKEEQSSGNRS